MNTQPSSIGEHCASTRPSLLRTACRGLASMLCAGAAAAALAAPTYLTSASTATDSLPGPQVAKAGSLLFFTKNDATLGHALWVSDGTPAGTHLVKAISPFATMVGAVGGVLLFNADDALHGTELWRSDGTEAGTYLLADIEPGPNGSGGVISGVALPNGRFVFQARNVQYGAEVWATDGTVAGTRLMKDIRPGSVNSLPQAWGKFGNKAAFQAFDDTNKLGLWLSDGTPEGTNLVKGFGTTGDPNTFIEFAGRLYFSARPTGYTHTWVSDGTTAGTQNINVETWRPVMECNGKYYFNTGVLNYIDAVTRQRFELGRTTAREAACFNGVLYYRGSDSHGQELWRSDGTAAGTYLLLDINLGQADSFPTGFAQAGGYLLFKARSGAAGEELWRTDGTASGTQLVRDIVPGSSSAGVGDLAVIGNVAYFTADTPGVSTELWMSDGTYAGTRPLREVYPPGVSPEGIVMVVNNKLFYVTAPAKKAKELWVLHAGGGTVVEYYWPAKDHYFITADLDEIAKLDASTSGTWRRTGRSFNTLASPAAGSSPVCRFYIPPQLGDSHFYGRGESECAATHARFPTFVYESPAVMHMHVPLGGVCPTGSVPVYRMFDNRPDSNHRYTTDRTVRAQMVTAGWVAEGDGPDLVVMCAPE